MSGTTSTLADSEMLVWDPTKTSLHLKLGEMIQYFQVSIPLNDLGIPKSYIDPTQILPQLPYVESPDDLPDHVVESSKIMLSYEDSIPTVDGVPFWERLEGEPVPYYKLFKAYREMKYLGIEDVHASLTRSVAKLSEMCGMSGKQLTALSRVYHWQIRVKAYDVFKCSEREAIRQREIVLMENKHAKISNKLLDQAVEYLLAHPEQLNPKAATDLVKLSMEAGRLALGLNANKPGSSSGYEGRSPQVSIINQQTMAGDGAQIAMSNVELSEVEKKTRENSQDVSHLQSILHVLNTSGAFSAASGQEKVKPRSVDEDDDDYDSEDANYIDVEYDNA